MPSTENPTLQRIQREISDVIEREKELRNSYVQNGVLNNNNEHETNNNITKVTNSAKPVLIHSISTSALNGTQSNSNGVRLFTSSPSSRGVMQKFIKARGKMTTVSGFQPNSLPIQQPQQQEQQQTWSIPDVIEPPKVTEPGKCIRKGYVPVQVRMQKELEDLHNREMELRSERRGHNQDSSDGEDFDFEMPRLETTLKPARSMAHLYDADEYQNESNTPPPSLKAARSLAELCDASEDELETPGSHSLIMRWEEMIQKKQQEHL